MNAAALGARRSLFGVRKEAAPNAERQTPNAKRRLRVLLVHNKLTRFVRIDRDLLWRRYDVDEFVVAGRWTSPWRVWRAVRRCDVLFCWFASMHSLLPALAGRVLGRPVMMVVGGYDTANLPQIAYGHQRGGLKKYVARAAMTLATRLIANSWYTAVEAVREAGMPAEKITVVYHGIALPMNGHRDGRDVARQTDLVLTVGNVDRPNLQRKGLEPFVQAAALLPHLRFVLVGAWLDGAIDDLRAIAPPNVTFTGRLCDAELHDLFGRAAVYVQASAHEGFGMALAEAMAAGCTPVVTRAGALPEVVGDAGVYAASADPGALATAIEHALAAGAPLGEAARARTAQSFTLDRRARALAAVVDAGGRRKADVDRAASAFRLPPGGGDACRVERPGPSTLNQPAELVQTVARAMRVAENLFFAGCGTAGKVALRSMISPPRLGLRGVRARWPRCAPCNGIHESGTVLGYVAIMRALQVLEGEGNVLDGQSS